MDDHSSGIRKSDSGSSKDLNISSDESDNSNTRAEPWKHVLGAGLGAVCADAIVKYEAKTAIELEQQIEESKKANRRRFQGEDCSLIIHVCLCPNSQKPFLLNFSTEVFQTYNYVVVSIL
jgi:hypothetical protein